MKGNQTTGLATLPPVGSPRQGRDDREQISIVTIGHVDHGKSTLIGRLLAETGSLPEGRLDRVREQCRRNSKPFEYAFLLDALKDEQAQGITIDSARCFFRTARREYTIIDAPGHIEFLKNMVSGAARAEAALIVIDAAEGVRENSRRHGYLASLLGLKQVAVCINKMDLIAYDRAAFEAIREEYRAFLDHVGISALTFIPLSGREGDNLVHRSKRMTWYDGPTLIEQIDAFRKEPPPRDKPLRLPVQDVYKFTAQGDDRRIVAGRIETGTLREGDEVLFQPSGKRSRVASIETFNSSKLTEAYAGQSTGVTLTEQIYVQPGELLCRADQPAPRATTQFRVNLFWLGRQPMIPNKRYKMKLAGARVPVWLREVVTVLDASELTTDSNKRQVERHDVAECLIETLKPVACDLATELPKTGRFVIIDNYEIAGGGIVVEAINPKQSLIEEHVRQREKAWVRSAITPGIRSGVYNQRPALILIRGPSGVERERLAQSLEEYLFQKGHKVYYLGLSNRLAGPEADLQVAGERDEYLRRLGETSHLFTDAGLILITTVPGLDDHEVRMLETLNQPNDLLVVSIGECPLARRAPDLAISDAGSETQAVEEIERLLKDKNYLIEYYL